MTDTTDAFYCGDLGTDASRIECCYKDPTSDCDYIFESLDGFGNYFQRGCNLTGNCVTDCQNLTYLYQYTFNLNDAGVNEAAIAPWMTCSNVPNIAGFLKQGALAPNMSELVQQYIPESVTDEALKNITKSLTTCLTSTCNQARNPEICTEVCSSVNLLINSTMPDYDGMNACLYSMCNGGYDAVPFANADIVGIGVFSSYVMQCAIILLIWFGFATYCILLLHKRSFFFKRESIVNQSNILVTGLVEFHKTQCFFSATIQAAALTYGLFEVNLLTVFLVIPLATNGIIPVIFGHLLVLRFGHGSVYLTSLTFISWLLSTVVFWILYSHVMAVNWAVDEYDVYQAIMLTLSENPECGGYTALAACPENMVAGIDKVTKGSAHIRHYTPALWAWGTAVFIVLLGYQVFRWLVKRKEPGLWSDKAKLFETSARERQMAIRTPFLRSLANGTALFWFVTVVFGAMVGLQLALLYVESSIRFFDQNDWSFGQIVAIAIWVPPFVEYLWLQLKGVEKAAEYRLAKSLKVSDQNTFLFNHSNANSGAGAVHVSSTTAEGDAHLRNGSNEKDQNSD